jgi:hypothetical protein
MVVGQIERGELTCWGAQEKYGIGGKMTVYNWMKNFSTLGLKKEEAMSPNRSEKELKRAYLESRVKNLEKALQDANAKIFALESLVEVYEAHEHKQQKKKDVTKVSSAVYRGSVKPKGEEDTA